MNNIVRKRTQSPVRQVLDGSKLQGLQHIGHDAVHMATDENAPNRVAKCAQSCRPDHTQIG